MKRVFGCFGLASALIFGGSTAFAQTDAAPSAPPPAAPAPAEAPKPSAGTVVVVADAFADETDNAKLRAKIYDQARSRGLSPDPKADVDGVARDVGAIKDGRVSADAAELESVRRQLHAAVLVRVSKDPRGFSVLVLRGNGDVKSTLVANADEVPARVAELVVAQKSPASAPTATGSEGLSAGYIVDRPKQETKDLTDPKQIAQAWEARGGLRASYGASAMATGLIIPNMGYLGQNPETGQVESGRATAYGVGGGLGLHFSLMYIPVREPASGGTSWAAFRVGTAFMLSGLYVRPPKEFSYKTAPGTTTVTSRETKYANDAFLYGVLPVQLGVHFGFGDYRLPTLWRGLALGLAYSPAWIFALDLTRANPTVESKFNYAGFEVSIDIVKLEAGQGSQPQLRLFALVLPRVKDDLPWLANAGIGAIWY